MSFNTPPAFPPPSYQESVGGINLDMARRITQLENQITMLNARIMILEQKTSATKSTPTKAFPQPADFPQPPECKQM